MLRSALCNYSDVYIVVKERISVTGTENANTRNKYLFFKNNAPFRSCISKINNTLIDSAEDIDTVMPMYNLLEYSNNFSMTSGSLWNYYRDEGNDPANEIDNNDNMMNNNKRTTRNSFEYKSKVIGRTPRNNNILDGEVVVLLKQLSNFWRSHDLPLINGEIEFYLTRSKDCVISKVSRTFRAVDPNVDPVEYGAVTSTTGATFQINNAKFYVPVVTSSINGNIKFLENIKQGFERTISWNKYRSEITIQRKNNN